VALLDSHADGAKIPLRVRVRILPLTIPLTISEQFEKFNRHRLGSGWRAAIGGLIESCFRRRPTAQSDLNDHYVTVVQRF
jgi:hypothetical protein